MDQASYARRVFILGMDGAGNFLQRLNRSKIARLARQHGVVTIDAMTELPTISAECWGAMLHGVTPDKHGYHNERAGAERFPLDSAYPSFFRLARERHPGWTLAWFTAWPPINYGLMSACSISPWMPPMRLATRAGTIRLRSIRRLQRRRSACSALWMPSIAGGGWRTVSSCS